MSPLAKGNAETGVSTRAKKIGLSLLVIETIYFVFTLLFLNGDYLKEAINKNPDEVRVEWRWAMSLLPGLVHVRGINVRVQDSNIQMYFEIPTVNVAVFIPSLWNREFQTVSVDGSGLAFRFRFRREEKEIRPEIFANLPPIPGLESVAKPPPAPDEGPPKDPWKVRLSGIDMEDVREIWFENYRFSGLARVGGSFALTPGHGAEVSRGFVNTESGEVFFGGDRVVEDLKTSIHAVIREFKSAEVPGLKLFDSLTAHVEGHGRIDNMRFLNYYLQRLPWLTLGGGSGVLDVDLKLREGVFENGSRLLLTSNNIEAHLWRQDAVGQGITRWEIEESAAGRRGVLHVELKDYEITHERHEGAKIKGKDLKIAVHTPDLRLSEAFPRLGVLVDLPEARITDLRYFNAYLPRSGGLRFTGGTGSVAGRFEADAHPDWNDVGSLLIKGQGAKIGFGKFSLQGNTKITARLNKGSIQSGQFDLSETKAEFSDVIAYLDRERVNEEGKWWGEAVLKEGKLRTATPARLEGLIRLRGKDARPLIAIFTPDGGLPEMARNFLSFDGLEASARLRVQDDELSIPGLFAEGGGMKLQGWLDKKDGEQEGKLLLEYGPLAAGLEVKTGFVQIKLNDAYRWFSGKGKRPSLAD